MDVVREPVRESVTAAVKYGTTLLSSLYRAASFITLAYSFFST